MIPTLEQKLAWLKLAPVSDRTSSDRTLRPGEYEIGFQRTNDILDEGMEVFVRSCRSAAIACWTSTSVRVSTELVASSRISSAGSARNALAMVSNCFSPALMLLPSSSISVSYPSGNEWTNLST